MCSCRYHVVEKRVYHYDRSRLSGFGTSRFCPPNSKSNSKSAYYHFPFPPVHSHSRVISSRRRRLLPLDTDRGSFSGRTPKPHHTPCLLFRFRSLLFRTRYLAHPPSGAGRSRSVANRRLPTPPAGTSTPRGRRDWWLVGPAHRPPRRSAPPAVGEAIRWLGQEC